MDSIEYKGYQIFIDQCDYEVESPLEWMTPEERGVWIDTVESRQYTLPKELNINYDEYDGWDEIAKKYRKEFKYLKFINWYEHSQISISLVERPEPNDRWDSSIIGIIVSNDYDALLATFKEWQCYIQGDIYSYSILDSDDELVDSLSEIYGYEYALKEAQQFIDSYIAPRKLAKSSQELHRGIV